MTPPSAAYPRRDSRCRWDSTRSRELPERPPIGVPMTITGRVVGRRRRYVGRGEPFRGEPQTGLLADEHVEDSGDHRCCDGIWDQLVRTLTDGRLARVRVRADVREPVAVRWPTARNRSLRCAMSNMDAFTRSWIRVRSPYSSRRTGSSPCRGLLNRDRPPHRLREPTARRRRG